MYDSLWAQGLYSPWNSPGQNTWVVPFPFSRGIFPTQGLNAGLLHCRRILYQLSHKGSPRTLNWVASLSLFSCRSSRPRNWTQVSCIAGEFFPTELSGKLNWFQSNFYLPNVIWYKICKFNLMGSITFLKIINISFFL